MNITEIANMLISENTQRAHGLAWATQSSQSSQSSQSTWSALVGIVVCLGLLLLVLLYEYGRRRPRKALTCEVIASMRLLDVVSENQGRLKVLLDGVVAEDVALVLVKLTNTGNVPISPGPDGNSGDYVEAVRIIFPAPASLLSYEVTETAPSELAPLLVQQGPGAVVLQPLLLKPGAHLTIRFLLESFAEVTAIQRILVTGRISGVKQLGLGWADGRG